MKRLYFSLLCAVFALSYANAAMPPAGTTVYLDISQNQTWINAINAGGNIRFHYYSSCSGGSELWVQMLSLPGNTIFYYTVPSYTCANMGFELRSSSNSRIYEIYSVDNWQSGQNCFILNSNAGGGNGSSIGTYGIYSTGPTVILTVTPNPANVGGSVTLSATTNNFSETPTFAFFVKTPESTSFEPITSPYSGFTDCGIYEFKVTATSDTESAETTKQISATRALQAGDVVYFQPNGWWNNSNAKFRAVFGGSVTIEYELVEGTAGVDGCVYGLIITPAAAAAQSSFIIQRYNPANSSVWNTIPNLVSKDWCTYNCFKVDNPSGAESGNGLMINYDAPYIGARVNLNVSSAVVNVGESINLFATTAFFSDVPTINYFVKLPNSENFVPISGLTYSFENCGVYEFKVIATSGEEEAEDTKNVVVTRHFQEGDIIFFEPTGDWARNVYGFKASFFTPESTDIDFTLYEGEIGVEGCIYTITITEEAAAQSAFFIVKLNMHGFNDGQLMNLESLDWCSNNCYTGGPEGGTMKYIYVERESIAVKAKIPSGWAGPNYGLYVWGCNIESENNWKNTTIETYDCEKWITYAFPVEVTRANVIFVNCGNTPNNFNTGGMDNSKNNNQTIDKYITSGACFEISSNTEGKREVAVTDCPTEEGCINSIYSPFAEKIDIFTQNKQINITSAETIGRVYIYNVQGQIIYENRNVNSNSLILENIYSGMYIIKVITTNNNFSSKIVL